METVIKMIGQSLGAKSYKQDDQLSRCIKGGISLAVKTDLVFSRDQRCYIRSKKGGESKEMDTQTVQQTAVFLAYKACLCPSSEPCLDQLISLTLRGCLEVTQRNRTLISRQQNGGQSHNIKPVNRSFVNIAKVKYL
jgi:hypothetical protein